MTSVRAAQVVPGSVHDVETLWYDTARWPSWVDGLTEIASVEGDWPGAGASVTWRSGPAGRGEVVERVVEHEPLSGQTIDVEDASIKGQQEVTFTPVDGGVEVELALRYEIRDRSIITPLLDVLFVRRAMIRSLRTTLAGFGSVLARH
jgi:hypothetical protein